MEDPKKSSLGRLKDDLGIPAGALEDWSRLMISRDIVSRKSLAYYIEECYATAKEKGFWEDFEDLPLWVALPIKMSLIMTELGEVIDEHRQSDNYESPKLKEELADVFIRLMDFIGWLQDEFSVEDFEEAVLKKMAVNAERPRKHGKKY